MMIGDKEIDIIEDDLVIDNIKHAGTPGFNELLYI